MRHKYQSRAIVLARAPLGEANTLVTLVTSDLGLVRARAQGLRKPSAKLAPALATFCESEVTLVRGSEGWRITGATLIEQWHRRLTPEARTHAARTVGLLLRLVLGQTSDATFFEIVQGYFEALATTDAAQHEAAECLAALRLVATLGLDGEALPSRAASVYDAATLAVVTQDRSRIVGRINRGIAASGL